MKDTAEMEHGSRAPVRRVSFWSEPCPIGVLWRSLFNTRNVVVLFSFFGLLFVAACLYNAASLLRLHRRMNVGAIVPIILFLAFSHGFFGVGYAFHRLEGMVMDANVRFIVVFQAS